MAGVEPELAGVVAAEPVAVAVAETEVLEAGVNDGVEAEQSGQMVTVSVVMKVE